MLVIFDSVFGLGIRKDMTKSAPSWRRGLESSNTIFISDRLCMAARNQ